ncbi:MAG: D-alanyl-D-alanine carboxypeptidase [Clostridiales bacterium]|nr:D-alanyl-D-alanine carboxypeptidase [Clostridiales bacterium]
MRKKGKLTFILLVCLIIATGFYLYIQKHGVVKTAGESIQISAGQAILTDGKTGRVIYERHADEKAYPASTTKIMTALITIETLEKYDSPMEQKVRVPAEAAGVEGSSIYLAQEEEISIEDLLYGLMLVSGNDTATALACIIGGDEKTFVGMMNDRAEALGCTGTNFTNSSGLFDENHYTTARDMAKISREAMKNKIFRRIVGTRDWQACREESQYNSFHNKNKTVHEFEGGNGVKIGYTESSGRTLVASAKRGKRTMICVVMSAPDWFNDAYRLMELGFKK